MTYDKLLIVLIVLVVFVIMRFRLLKDIINGLMMILKESKENYNVIRKYRSDNTDDE